MKTDPVTVQAVELEENPVAQKRRKPKHRLPIEPRKAAGACIAEPSDTGFKPVCQRLWRSNNSPF